MYYAFVYAVLLTSLSSEWFEGKRKEEEDGGARK